MIKEKTNRKKNQQSINKVKLVEDKGKWKHKLRRRPKDGHLPKQ